MAVLVRVAGTPKGGGSSGAGRYIVERELDKERESRETRQIFTAREDNLHYRQGDKYLAGDAGWLDKEDLHHVIISLLPEDYERLGDNDLERRAVLIKVTREALANLSERDLDGYEWRWAASLHLNTRLPHVHLLMHKEMVDPITGEKKILKRLPKELLAERGSTIRDEDPARMGKISQRFKEALDEHSKPFRHIQIRDAESRVLADRAIIEGGAAGERKPTFEEVSVGRWVVAEAKAARADGGDTPPPLALREYVRKLDAHTAGRGLDSTAAYLSQEQISELTSYRTSELRIIFHSTETSDRRGAPERPSRDKFDRVSSREEHEERRVRRSHSPDDDQVRPNRVLKDELLKERRDREPSGISNRGALIPRQAEGRDLPSRLRAGFEENVGRRECVAVEKGEKPDPKARVADSHPRLGASSRKEKHKAQEELFESRGWGLIAQYFALSVDPGMAKEFAIAARNQMEAGRRLESLEKNYRERYGEDAPTGATLSAADKDHLIRNVPKIHHVPSIVRNGFLHSVHAARTPDHARSFLPRESRPFHDRRLARDNRKGGRGR